MWQTTEVIDIQWEQAAVFDYLAHFENIGEWDGTVMSARPMGAGAPAVGSRYQLSVGFGPQRIPMTYEIVDMAPPHRLVLKGTGQSFTAHDDIALTTVDGATRIEYQVSLDFRKHPPVGAAWLVKRLFLKNVRRAAKRLAGVFNGVRPLPKVTPAVRVIDGAILPGMAGFTRLGYRMATDYRPFASARLLDRTVVITGATGGIGLAAAQSLRRLGARLIIVGRDPEKTTAVCRRLERIPGRGSVETAFADMSLVTDVRRLAEELSSRLPEIHVLINNAGALFTQREVTAEGIEKSFAVNLLGPYALSRLMLPTLRRSRPARIINVASGGMYTQAIDLDDLESVKTPYNGAAAYARAKRGMAIVSREMGKRLQAEGVFVHCMHPGWVDTPGLRQALPGFYERIGSWLRTPSEGADTIVWLSAAAEGALTSGLFWRDRRPRAEYVLPGTREGSNVPKRLFRVLDQYTEST